MAPDDLDQALLGSPLRRAKPERLTPKCLYCARQQKAHPRTADTQETGNLGSISGD